MADKQKPIRRVLCLLHAVCIDIDQWIAKNLAIARTRIQPGLQQVLDCPTLLFRVGHTFYDGDRHG